VSTSPDGRPPLRIGTQEREAACQALDVHLTAGRLDAEEYGERYATASLARNYSELDALFFDLPAPHWAPRFAAPTWPAPPPWSARATWPAHWPQQPQDPRSRQMQQPQWRRYVPATALGRIATAILIIAAAGVLLPMAAAGVLLWFVVIPIVMGRGPGHRRYRDARGRSWYA
jgi:Domain of unknown function (DUF1707)